MHMLAVPGRNEDRKIRFHVAQRADQGDAVHERHRNVSNHRGDLAGFLRKSSNTLGSIRSEKRAIAMRLEDGLRDETDARLVVHDQDQFVMSQWCYFRGYSFRTCRCCFRRRREKYLERGAFAELAFDEKKPVMAFHDAMHGGKAEAGSLANFLRGKKRIKDPFVDLRRDANATVAHLDQDVRTRLRVGSDARAVLGVDLNIRRGDTQAAAM